MNAREELERIIDNLILVDGNRSNAKAVAKAILDAGFVRLEDVEIDWEKTRASLSTELITIGYRIAKVDVEDLAHAIAFTKPMRVKEGKK